MNRIITTLILFIVSIGLSSCSFHWQTTDKKAKRYYRNADDTSRRSAMHVILPQPDFDTVPAINPAQDSSGKINQLIAQLTPVWEARIDYKTFSGKANIDFRGPDDDKVFTAHFRVRKDSVIWVNVTYDAINVARLFITRDSFFLLNTIDQEITRIPLSQAAKILPAKVDFTSLQNLVTGEPLRKGRITKAAAYGDSLVIQVEDSSYIQHITFNKADSTIRTDHLRTWDPKGPQAFTAYSNYEIIDNRKISTFRTLNIQKGNEIYILDMNFNKVNFNEDLDYPFSIPQNYTEKNNNTK